MLIRSLITSLLLSFLFPLALKAMPICEFQLYKLSSRYQESLVQRNLRTQLELAEEEAIKAIFKLVLNEDKEREQLNLWIEKLESSEENLRVAEHAALSYLYRNPEYLGLAVDESLQNGLKLRVEALLKRSWQNLVGEEVLGSRLGERLPRSLLDGQSNKVLMFYQTSFNEYNEDGTSTFSSIFHQLISTEAEYKAFITTMIVTSMAFAVTGGQNLSLGISGVALMSISENLFHRYLAHPSAKMLDTLKKSKLAVKMGLFKMVHDTGFNHQRVHHGPLSFLDYNKQFKSIAQMLKTDNFILKHMSEFYVKHMKKTGYGLAISDSNYLSLISPFIVLTVLGLAIGVEPVQLALLLGPGYFYPIGLLSEKNHEKRYEEGGDLRPESEGLLTFHEYTHLKQEELDRITSEDGFLRGALSTKVSEIIRGIHWVHHDKPSLNFNLTNFIGDILLGTLSLPDMEKLAEMDRDHDMGYYWGASVLNPE